MKDSDKLNYNEGLYMENVYLFQGLIITVFSFYYFRNLTSRENKAWVQWVWVPSIILA